jgi:hypothetical protein
MRYLLLVCLCLMTSAALAPADEVPPPYLAVAASPSDLSVNPVLHRAQLAKGLGFSGSFSGFVEHGSGNAGFVGDIMHPQFRVAHNERMLVLQVYMPLPYRRAVLARAAAAQDLDRDDTVEVWIEPRQSDGKPRGDTFRVRGNLAGVAAFLRDEPEVGQYDMAWQTQAVFRTLPRDPDGYWAAVIGIPWDDLGGPPRPGDVWGFQAALRYADPVMIATLSPTAKLNDTARFARVCFDRDHANVSVVGPGRGLRKGALRLSPLFANPTAQARQVEAEIFVLRDDTTLASRRQTFELPPSQIHVSGSRRIDVDFTAPPADDRQTRVRIVFRDLQSQQAIYDQTLPVWREASDPLAALDQLYQTRFNLLVGPYPATGMLEYQIDSAAMQAIRSDLAQVRLTLNRDGRELLVQTHAIASTAASAGLIKLPADTQGLPMPPGRYELIVAMLDAQGREISRNIWAFERKVMPFETEPRPGLSDRVPPPFTEPTVEGSEVTCWARRYRHGREGLITALIAAERDLLAQPVALRVRRGESWRTLAATGDPTLRPRGAGQIDFEQSFRDGTLAVRVEGVMDYDGFYLFTFTSTSPDPIDALQLQIPLRAQHATLFDTGLTSTNLWRESRPKPIGALPAGQGVVWDSLTWKDDYRSKDQRQSNMPPYLWVGDDDRGLAFSCASDQGTSNDPARPAVTIERPAPDRVLLCVSLLNRPGMLDGTPFQMALQASPFKPMPEHHRLWRNATRSDNTVNSYLKNGRFLGKIFDYRANYPVYGRWLTLDYLRQMIAQSKADGVDWVSMAASATSESGGTPEYQQFWRQWGSPLDWEQSPKVVPGEKVQQLMTSLGLPILPGLNEEQPSNSCASNVDFRVWWLAQGVQAGLATVYQDNQTHVFRAQPGSGYGYQRPDGGWEPTSSVWNSRTFLRRATHVFAEAGLTDTPYVLPHLCNVALPGRSFSRAVLLGEYGSSNLVPLDAFRVFTSKQWGYALFWLNSPAGGVVPRSYWRGFYSRLLLHDVTCFTRRPDIYVPWQLALDAFWLDDPSVRFHAYFRDPLLSSQGAGAGANVLVSGYSAADRCLLVISNQGERDGVAKLRWNARPDTLANVRHFVDLETGEAIQGDSAGLTLFVPRDDYRLVLGTEQPWPWSAAADLKTDLPVQSTLDRRATVQRMAQSFLQARTLGADRGDHAATALSLDRLVRWLDSPEQGATYRTAQENASLTLAGRPLRAASLWNPKLKIMLVALHNADDQPLVLDETQRVSLVEQVGGPKQRYVRWLDDPALGARVNGVFDLAPGEARFELLHWGECDLGPLTEASPAPSRRALLMQAVLANRASRGR